MTPSTGHQQVARTKLIWVLTIRLKVWQNRLLEKIWVLLGERYFLLVGERAPQAGIYQHIYQRGWDI